ncbi:MAG: ribonuclease Z [Bacteroidales bacterium]
MAFSATILGSSSATPTSKRNPSSILLNMNYKFFLVDCGEGTQIQLRRFRFKIQKIRHIFISHLHGDHFFGLVGLISSMHLLGRQEDLHVYADPRIKGIIDLQMEASATELRFNIVYHPTNPSEPEILYEDDDHFIRSFPLDHRIPTTGFLFSEKKKPLKIRKEFVKQERPTVEEIHKIKSGEDYVSQSGRFYKNSQITIAPPPPRSFAYCSDTRYNEATAEYVKGSDLVYHEATFMEDMADQAEEKYHSTAAQAADIARKAGAGRLIIGHFSARYKNLEKLLEEAKQIFPETELAEDGLTFKIVRK